jgi:hypothetical protein
MSQKTPLKTDDRQDMWKGAFNHLLNDTKVRKEKQRDLEDIVKKQV